jgi:hypothetical protein
LLNLCAVDFAAKQRHCNRRDVCLISLFLLVCSQLNDYVFICQSCKKKSHKQSEFYLLASFFRQAVFKNKFCSENYKDETIKNKLEEPTLNMRYYLKKSESLKKFLLMKAVILFTWVIQGHAIC